MDPKIFMLDSMHVVNLTFSEQNYHSNMLESVLSKNKSFTQLIFCSKQ